MYQNGDKIPRGTQIAYVPMHVGNPDLPESLLHPDTEFGFVTSGPNREGDYFCRYWRKGHLGDLRTKANSELTPVDMIVVHDAVPQQLVEQALEEYC